ncbi:acyl carrier protein [Nonomuraea basaltis]|uniref:acyl carrier protein n=1 Tax=Nonomuraea basaltis TaxID=2495887 RepID=UPI00110C607D|nr:phosphopantetheine-binding protein [Nonomuraea basaltis]TMR91445.1 acyl carrier protein [Nonomuraea basaltis]
MTPAPRDLERMLADMVADVSGGEISAEEALAGDHSLPALGLTSLAWIRLVDAIEDAFGVDVDLGGDLSAFEHVDALAAHLSGLLDSR